MRRLPRNRAAVRGTLATAVAGLVASATLTAPAAHADQVTPGNFTGYAFDQCLTPTQAKMDAWMEHSPFAGVGIYISGDSRACRSQPNLTATWVKKQIANGWKLLPITLGPQANCLSRFPRYKDDKVIAASSANTYAAARKQARAEAAKAVAAAQKLGIDAGSTLWYDLEGFDSTKKVCRESAMWFLSDYNKTIKSLGYVSGVYSSAGSGIKLLDDARVKEPGKYTLPDRLWVARWDGVANLESPGYLRTDGWMPHGRVKQYRGGHNETWGGVTINIDSNFMSLGKGSTGTPGGVMCKERVQANLSRYPVVRVNANSGTVKALQCLLRKAGHYRGPVSGRFDNTTLQAANAFQRRNGFNTVSGFTRKQWTSLLSIGNNPTIKRGSAGVAVRKLQRTLTAATGRPMTYTGVFDAGTEQQVKAWQKQVGLPQSGVVNKAAWRLLQQGKIR
ncbi:glycoside hydrolase domain-containing protein [Nocardioides sp. Bht2]|uniref:glycoside hydrolase domain-containing protein n=1 Tax=Nocardioides sp. Bht2 TaxID=3392297 RepID=UPI0039B4C20A